MALAEDMLKVHDIKKYFPIKSGFLRKKAVFVKAVDGISFSIRKGETMGLVGESGSGKTTAGRVILRLLEATAGRVTFNGLDIFNLGPREIRRLRKEAQIIFQNPYSSLDPMMTVQQVIGEGLEINKLVTGKKEKEKRIKELLETVGLSSTYISRSPHEFSGGQRQRIGIARALAVNPKFIVCDEPVSALDVSVQAQIINLLEDLQDQFNLTYLFIAHDLSVVKHISDRVAVMYLGKIVELASSESLFTDGRHPYTKALLSAIPIANPEVKRQRILLEGNVPSPINPPSGCRFHQRCFEALRICKEEEPLFREVKKGHYVSCHLV